MLRSADLIESQQEWNGVRTATVSNFAAVSAKGGWGGGKGMSIRGKTDLERMVLVLGPGGSPARLDDDGSSPSSSCSLHGSQAERVIDNALTVSKQSKTQQQHSLQSFPYGLHHTGAKEKERSGVSSYCAWFGWRSKP